jgi:hypothetical protein
MVKRSKTAPLWVRVSPEVEQALADRMRQEQDRRGLKSTYGLQSEIVEEILRREFNLPPIKKEGE